MNTIEKALRQNRKNEPGKPSVPEVNQVSTGQVELNLEELESLGMLTPDNGRSRIAEELRAIKRPLLRRAFQESRNPLLHNNLIMITSALPGEGKSFTSINLAMSIAMELDRTVLLVDADVAKPSLMGYLNLQNSKGLVDYLLDDSMDLSEVLLKTNVPELSILPAGKPHHHATELLASEAMNGLLTELATRYPDRIVLFDSPPLLVTSESRVLAGLMGQVLVVVEAVGTTHIQLKEAMELLRPEEQEIGLVLNKYRGAESKGYYYGTYYGPDVKSS